MQPLSKKAVFHCRALIGLVMGGKVCPAPRYLTTNLHSVLAEIVRLYGLPNEIEQGYKQIKDELGWADIMVRSGRAIRRH